MTLLPLPPDAPTGPPLSADRLARIEAVAKDLEASFLSEMLKHAGVATPSETMGGGPGEDAFAGFLTKAYADELSRAGGIGLSEHIVAALIARENGG